MANMFEHSGAALRSAVPPSGGVDPLGPVFVSYRQSDGSARAHHRCQLGELDKAEPGDQADAHGYLVLTFVAGTRSLTRDGVADPLLEKGLDGHGAAL